MLDYNRLMALGPGDKMTMTFVKNPKPSWLSQNMPGSSPNAPQTASAVNAAPAPMPGPVEPEGDEAPPSPMAMELMRRMGGQ